MRSVELLLVRRDLGCVFRCGRTISFLQMASAEIDLGGQSILMAWPKVLALFRDDFPLGRESDRRVRRPARRRAS